MLRHGPYLPTRSLSLPVGPDWIQEIKHDGYRLIVQRQDKVVRLSPGMVVTGPIATLG
jgi:ATP-dependent DNA ligase